jgi:C-terminal processing protease CtpA/Prc
LEEVRDAVESVGKIDWIILDLRWNSWWYLEEAVKLLGHFFPKNEPLVKSKYKAFNDLDYNSEWRW